MAVDIDVHVCVSTLGEWRNRAEGTVDREKPLQGCVQTKKNKGREMRPWGIPSFQKQTKES